VTTASLIGIRPATSADLDSIGALTADAYLHDEHVGADSEYLTVLRDATVRAEQATLLVAMLDDDVVGTVTFARPPSPLAQIAGPGEAEFRALAVSPRVRNRGVGDQLVRACIDLAAGHGDTALVLSTLDNMHAAHRLYTRRGFYRLPERDWSPRPGADLQVYGLVLSSRRPATH